METDADRLAAWRIVTETDANLFLTGKAGTGKTTFLRELQERCPKRMVVLAPTGIAAINAGGVTIHSFFQLPFAPFMPESSFGRGSGAKYDFRYNKQRLELIRTIDLIVIDEISMVRADLLDEVDYVLRRFRDRTRPFGGVQMVMIGDLAQLPPVVKDDEWDMLRTTYDTPYFFSSNALRSADFFIIELSKVYRQSDETFIALLNKVRDNTLDDAALAMLNSRYVEGFTPPEGTHYIRLTTHNAMASQINESELARLPAEAHTFVAGVTGKFPSYSYPTDEQLVLKAGAQVMFVKNGTCGTVRYCNGTLGHIDSIDDETVTVTIDETGEDVTLHREVWTNTRYAIDRSTKAIVEEVEGTFMQFPLKLAWAITIHKSQGLTFDRAIIDAAGSFSHGQAYVALSRCRTLGGMVLSRPLTLRSVITDSKVETFMAGARSHVPTAGTLDTLRKRYYTRLLDGLFDFTEIATSLDKLRHTADSHLAKTYPALSAMLADMASMLSADLTAVAGRFHHQYSAMAASSPDPETDGALAARLAKATTYFTARLQPLSDEADTVTVDIDNAATKKAFDEALDTLRRAMLLKLALLRHVGAEGFDINGYLHAKAVATIETGAMRLRRKRRPAPSAPDGNTDITHPDLYDKLIKWRDDEARSLGKPVYTVVRQSAIAAIAGTLPRDKAALLAIPHFGPKTFERYGREILAIIDSYLGDTAPGGLWHDEG